MNRLTVNLSALLRYRRTAVFKGLTADIDFVFRCIIHILHIGGSHRATIDQTAICINRHITGRSKQLPLITNACLFGRTDQGDFVGIQEYV